MAQRNGCPACCAESNFDECEDDSGTFIDDYGVAWHRDCLERVLAPYRQMWDAGRFDDVHEAIASLQASAAETA